MRSSLLDTERRHPDEIWLKVMAMVAVGMFVGAWVLGPFFNRSTAGRGPLDSATSLQQALEDASRRPDPSPYRTPTPAFEQVETHYAAAAKARAQASVGLPSAGQQISEVPEAFRQWPAEEAPAPRRQWRASSFDRHTGVRY
jgi:hypothetical protein